MDDQTRNECASIRRLAAAGIAALALITFASGVDAGPKGKDRPFNGSCDTFITPLTAPGVFPAIIAVDTACNLTHLGSTTGSTDLELIIPSGPPVGTVLPISVSVPLIVYNAADGDQLFSTFAGTGAIDFATGVATFDGTETFLGGTGRFLNASGQTHTVGAGSLFTNRGAFTTSGNISY
jgi:hypothetical protein